MTTNAHPGKRVVSPLASKRVLVWGACGFIGEHLVRRLLSDAARVSVLTFDRRRYPVLSWADEVDWYELHGSSSDELVLAEAVESAELIYNLAGSSGAVASNREPLASMDSICRAQLQMLQAIQVAGHRPHVVFASSRLVYGPTAAIPVAEEGLIRPMSMYAVHKWCAERYHEVFAAQDALTYTTCRITNPFGSSGAKRARGYGFINQLIFQGLEGQPLTIYGNGRQQRDYLHIDDLVEALVLCGNSLAAVNQVFNVGRGTGISIIEAASLIKAATGAGPLRFLRWPPEHAAVESGDFVADISKARSLLGFQPRVDFESGLLATIHEERERQQVSNVNYRNNVVQKWRKLGAGLT